MKTAQIPICFLSMLMLIVSLINCTELPFGSDEISAGHRQISGKVKLHDGSSPENVYVWLSSFNIGAYTDQSGEFKLTLPPKSSMGTSGGVSGTFDLYFYIANYKLVSSQVVVRDGEFVYSRGDINKAGALYETKTLRRFLRVNTSVSPASVAVNYTGSIEVKVALQATIDSATVIIPESFGGMLGAVFVKKIDSQEVFIYKSVPITVSSSKLLVGLSSQSLSMTFNLILNPLLPGKYEVIPYLLIAHETIPDGLIENIGSNVRKLHPDYLKIPFKREGGEFEVH